MAQVALTTADALEIVESLEQHDGVCNVDISAGEIIRQDNTTGKWVKSLATTAANARGSYMATRTAKAGTGLTGLKRGVVDGFALSGLNYSAEVFVSDTAGQVADAAGTVSIQAGTVLGQFGEKIGTAPRKLLRVALP